MGPLSEKKTSLGTYAHSQHATTFGSGTTIFSYVALAWLSFQVSNCEQGKRG
jgi:myo-inositol catabolism protein IolC